MVSGTTGRTSSGRSRTGSPWCGGDVFRPEPGGLGLLSLIPPVNGAAWIIAGSTLQAIGGGLLFTPLITIGLSTLPPELRTDATGLYSLLRQVGSASGLALMTGLLQVRIQAHLPALPAW